MISSHSILLLTFLNEQVRKIQVVGLWGRKSTAENVTLPPQETVIRKAEDRRPTTKSVRWGGETERGNQSPISHSRSPISGKGIRWDSEPLEASDVEAEGGDFQRLRIQTAGTSRTQDSRPGLSVLCFISLFCHVLVGTDFALGIIWPGTRYQPNNS